MQGATQEGESLKEKKEKTSYLNCCYRSWSPSYSTLILLDVGSRDVHRLTLTSTLICALWLK